VTVLVSLPPLQAARKRVISSKDAVFFICGDTRRWRDGLQFLLFVDLL
jgi:hypothetical protein